MLLTSTLTFRILAIVLLGFVAAQVAFHPVGFSGWVPNLQHPSLHIGLGLDLRGGSRLVLEAGETPTAPATPEAVDAVGRVIASRIDQLGVVEPTIQRQGAKRIVVELPGVQDPDRAIALIGKTALLEFVDTGATQLPRGARWAAEGKTVNLPGSGESLPLPKKVIVTGTDLTEARASFDRRTAAPAVYLRFKDRGAAALDEFTRTHIGQYLTIVLDNEAISSPIIRDRISDGSAQIFGGFRSLQDAHDLAVLLRGGALPLPVQVVENRTVGPLLGRDAIEKSVRAGYVAAAAIVLFMGLYYGVPGILADVALGLYALLILATLSVLGATLTLPGITGLILSVGVAVDANVIIYEKVKEELRAGKALRAALASGWSRGLVTIIDSNATTLLGALVLFALGTGTVKGFAVTLGIGVLISMFTATFVARVLVNAASAAGLETALAWVAGGPARRTVEGYWDIIGRRRLGYLLSLLVILPGIVALILNAGQGHGALDWGIDFTGGHFLQLRLERPFAVTDVRQVVDRYAPGQSIIQKSGQEVLIRTRPLAEGTRPALVAALREQFGTITLLREEEVGPRIGRELRSIALASVALGLALQAVYISVRFRSIRFAVAADLALMHDLLVVIGVFALTRKEVNSSFVAVLLTVVGYSLNDTVVLFDRVRENLVRRLQEPFDRLVNRSILEALVRSINTALTTILAVGAIYAFGGSTIHDFAFGLMIGILTGGYSSILIACPILVDWYRWSERPSAGARVGSSRVQLVPASDRRHGARRVRPSEPAPDAGSGQMQGHGPKPRRGEE